MYFLKFYAEEGAEPVVYECPSSRRFLFADEYQAAWLARQWLTALCQGFVLICAVTGAEVGRWAWNARAREVQRVSGIEL